MANENQPYEFPLARKSHNKPLKGVRVIDAGNMVAAPFATVLLADFGAEVIKLEHPEYGDGQRKLEPITEDGVPLWWKAVARNKRCITLNLGKPEGAEIFKDLCRNCDVVVENYRPGTFERWGIGQDVIEAIDPRIIMLRISGFGQTGPYRNRAGFGRVAEAMAGLTNLIGEPDGPPMTPGYPLGDLIAGIFGAFSVMVALYNRDARGGTGQAIDLALFESVFRLLDFDAIQYDQLNTVHMRSGNSAAYVAPSSTFRTRDGKWLTRNVWSTRTRSTAPLERGSSTVRLNRLSSASSGTRWRIRPSTTSRTYSRISSTARAKRWCASRTRIWAWRWSRTWCRNFPRPPARWTRWGRKWARTTKRFTAVNWAIRPKN